MSNAPPSLDLTVCGYIVKKWVGHCFNAKGDVYLARCNDASDAALRRIPHEILEDTKEVTNEVSILRTLCHANIIECTNCFVYNESVYLTTPLCAYGSALDLLMAYFECGLPEKAISSIVGQTIKALSYIHEMGVIHRGVRASHILINDRGAVKLTGFRCAIQLPKGREVVTDFERDLHAGLVWLAPEILAQDLNGYGTISDIYSLGITMCELGNGFAPFRDMEPLQMLYEKGLGTTPKLLDANTLRSAPLDSQSAHRYRELTDHFHNITEQCLRSSQFSRPTAKELMVHPFLRTRRKNVLKQLPRIKVLDDQERDSARGPLHLPPPTECPEWN